MASVACEGGDIEVEVARLAAAKAAVEQRTDAERQARLESFRRMQQPPPPLPTARAASAHWPMARADALGRGRTALVGPSTAHVRWELDLGAAISAPVVTVSGGALAVGLADGRAVAVSLGGELAWTFDLGAPVSTAALTLASGDLVFATEAGEVVALTADGALRWRTLVDAAGIVAAPVVTPGGRVAVGTLGGTLALLEPTGALAWTRSLGGAVRATPVVTSAGHLVVASQGRGLSSLDQQGAVLWSRRGPGPVRGALAIGPTGRILGAARGLALFALESSGAPAWEVRARPSPPPEGGPSVLPTGDAIVGTVAAEVLRIDGDGGVIWRRATRGAVNTALALDARGTAYFATDTGWLQAFDHDGALTWEREIGGVVRASPTLVAPGLLVAGTPDGRLVGVGAPFADEATCVASGVAPCACACAACPGEAAGCLADPGCQALATCSAVHECTGGDCLRWGWCGAVAHEHGGLHGPSARLFLALDACAAPACGGCP